MSPNLANYALSGIMILAGIGIPIMASLNAGLGLRLGAPAAGLVLFIVATGTTLVVTSMTGGISVINVQLVPKYLFLGGLIVVFYVLSITFIAPIIGVGNAIFLVLLGQMTSAVVIDQVGWLGSPKTEVDILRLTGLVLMAAGIYLARRPNIMGE